MTSSRSTPGGAVGIRLEADAGAARPHEIGRRSASRASTSPCRTPAKKLSAAGSDGVRNTTRRNVPWPVGAAGSPHQRGLRVRSVLGDVVEELLARLGMAVRLRELHDGAVRFARHEERFFPLGIARGRC